MRIIQTNDGISIDQAEYVYNLVHNYFASETLDHIKTVSTPLRSDNNYEHELYEAAPMDADEMKLAMVRHRGSYRHHIGGILYAAIMTRFDVAFAVQRLSEFCVSPNTPAWEGVHRIMRYFAGDVLRPLYYPRVDLDGSNTITAQLTPDHLVNLDISNTLNLFTDAEYVRDPATQHTYYCSVITFLGAAIHYKVKKARTVFTNTTDAEVYAAYDGVKRLKPISSILTEMGFIVSNPTVTHIDNQAAITIIAARRMTPRCQHLDIPIASLIEAAENGTIAEKKVQTHLQLADSGTKQSVPVVHRRHKYWVCGQRFYP